MTKGRNRKAKALFQICKVLWHLDIFRRSFRDLSGHACMADSCIFCALKELFSQLQFSNETALPPDALRRALAESFFDQQRFQLGFMDDAAECFENMLLRIHMHIAHGEAEDMCNARHCIPHQKFAMTLVEQSVCNSCGATSEPLSYTQMVHYVSTSTLVYQVRSNRPQGIVEPFGQLLRKAESMGDNVRVCPSACGAVIQIGRTLMNRPEIVSVGLVWNSERPTLEHIMEVFSTIGTTLRLSDVFNTVVDSRWASTSIHHLVGVVTYYGKHYSTFFFHTKLRVWIYFDDATVREVGPRWEQVVDKCRKGRYQPLLLLYALPDGTPVNTEQAPKQITPFYKHEKTILKKMLRRSVTPSPEKVPIIGTVRRAITPNPEGVSHQKPPLPRAYNEYQNLSVIQSNLFNNNSRGVDVVDGEVPQQKPSHIYRTLSNGSSSGTESFRDYLNVPRTRDSGNWSSDRNSASSASSTTMENPYLYYVSKENANGAPEYHLSSRVESSNSSNSSGAYDVGYDSYSLSSNDSSTMTTIQHLMKMGHLAKIPEDYNTTPTQISQSCDVLCDEADDLLVKSRQLEDDHDLVLALALCNAAATKARAAMDAPYNNPQTLTLARMKHNTCIMRARSLHRRMTQNTQNKDAPPEIRHTREGSSGSGKHSRQSSRDKGTHSRQNSKELLVVQDKPTKNHIEIYATLPKKRDTKKSNPEEMKVQDSPRQSRSIFSRSSKDKREKRSRSEDRNKMSRDFSIAPEVIKDTLKREEKEEKKDKKKQHKIRRKLMGGLIRRKNRSMPDLTEANNEVSPKPVPNSTVDDSGVGLKASEASMCGYLSEGHLEFTGNSTNPNLERSKLMRKGFHSVLTVAKVPPPPPLRTTSQLSKAKPCPEVVPERPQYPLPNHFQYNYPFFTNTVVTRADVHQEPNQDSGVDEVDCLPSPQHNQTFELPKPNLTYDLPPQTLELPPYPSPLGSVVHSRQASEEFPPPPPPLELEEEKLLPPPGSLLAQLQTKRQQILSQDNERVVNSEASRADTWLKELQAKQAALKMRKSQENDVIPPKIEEVKLKSVRDLANKFEVQVDEDCEEESKRNRLAKKKSVSFCDQVILVATAEEQEDDSYIPNPILERVLRSAMNKPETAAVREEVLALRQEMNNDEEKMYPPLYPMYVRRNSMDNLLSRPNPEPEPTYIRSSPQNINQGLYAQSPYQRIPQNSPAYMYNNNNNNINIHSPQPNPYPVQNQSYSPRQAYPMGQSPNHYPVYQHPPSPAPYQQNMYQRQGYAPPEPYQQLPECDPYQPLPQFYPESNPQRECCYPNQYSVYQHVYPSPKHLLLKKSVSFEPGTKGGAESPTPKAIVTPIIVNNANNSVPTGKTKCNLCRKKAVVSSNLYCTDCEFYMSRFKQKR